MFYALCLSGWAETTITCYDPNAHNSPHHHASMLFYLSVKGTLDRGVKGKIIYIFK